MRHFYHLYCGYPWREIATAHLEALAASGAAWNVTVGLVGPADERRAARRLFRGELLGVDFIEADRGYEQVTLLWLHRWAKMTDPQAPVLYAHSKGVIPKADPQMNLHGKLWRELMTGHLVLRWRECVALLEDHDAVGCYWATPQMYPGFVVAPMFAGNFWWARAGYLATLAPVSIWSRWHAEGWIGTGNPAVADVHPGWPTWAEFAPQVIAALNREPSPPPREPPPL